MKKYIKPFALLIVLIFLAILIFSSFSGNGFFIDNDKEDQMILEIMYVETFEGGKNSRKNFLIDAGEILKETYPEVNVKITQVPFDTLKQNSENMEGHLISFGFGAGEILQSHLAPYEGTLSMSHTFWSSGVSEDEVLAVPYMFGMYYFFQDGAPLHYGTENACSTLLGGYYDKNRIHIEEFSSVTKDEAYRNFLKGGSLLGSQRDVVKVRQYEEKFPMEYDLERMENYTDLVQYISLTKNLSDKEKVVAEKYIEILTSEKMAKKTEEYYMFNILEIAGGNSSEGFEKSNISLVPNVFIPNEHLLKNQKIAYLALTGGEAEQNFLKDIFKS